MHPSWLTGHTADYYWVWFYWKSEYITSTGSPLSTHLTDKFAEPQQVSAAALGWTEDTLPSSQQALSASSMNSGIILYHRLCSLPEEAAPSPLHLPRQSEWELQWHSGLPIISRGNKGVHIGQQLSSHLSSSEHPQVTACLTHLPALLLPAIIPDTSSSTAQPAAKNPLWGNLPSFSKRKAKQKNVSKKPSNFLCHNLMLMNVPENSNEKRLGCSFQLKSD